MSNTSFATTTPVVDAISRIHFSGNILPHNWFKQIRLVGGHPDTIGCVLLSEIVYWYRSQEQLDEETGQVIGRHKRFRADKLQRSSQAFASKFGFSKRQVLDALNRLEDGGYITKELRTTTTSDGTTLTNVCFVEPVVTKIEAITFPDNTKNADDEEGADPDPLRSTADPVRLNADPLRSTADPPTPERTLQETTTRDSNKKNTYVGDDDAPSPEKITKKKEANPDGSYGNPEVAELKAYLKERLGLEGLDDRPDQVNRTAWTLLRKKSEDTRPPLVRLKEMIDAVAEDRFWSRKLTSLQGLHDRFYEFQKLARAMRPTTQAVTVDEQGVIRGHGYIDISNVKPATPQGGNDREKSQLRAQHDEPRNHHPGRGPIPPDRGPDHGEER